MKFTPAYGYIKIKREIVYWHWYKAKDQNPYKLAMHLIFSVNHKASRFLKLIVLPGQTVTSIQHLADETGMTFSQVRTALDNLISTNDIAKESTSHYTILMLSELRRYVEGEWVDDIPFSIKINNQLTNKSQTNRKQIATNNNNSNNSNNSNYLIRDEILKIENSKIFFQTLSMKYKVSKQILLDHFKQFYDINYAEKSEKFGPDQVKQHFANWVEKNKGKIIKKGLKSPQKKNDDGYYINR